MLVELSVKVLLLDENGCPLLLARHSNQGDLFWDLPGGRVRKIEPLTAALRRELLEEVHYTGPLEGLSLLTTEWYQGSERPKLIIVYQAKAKRFTPVLSAEHDHALWLSDSKQLHSARLEEEMSLILTHPDRY